jgi:hypothetical protein
MCSYTKLLKCNRVLSLWVAGLTLAGAIFISSGFAQTPSSTGDQPHPSAKAPSAKPTRHSPYAPTHPPQKATDYFTAVWGVDSLTVRAVESGKLVRFSYQVVDPAKAAILNDKKFEAFLDSPEHHMRLIVPTMEKVGQLRQTNKPEKGKSYWMAFSNPQRNVRKGDHVNVVIGRFHADGLIVE